jgi:type I restriction enzyme, S subunit
VSLPEGWVRATLGECSNAIQYGLTSTSSSNGTGYRYVRITDIQDGQIRWQDVPFANEEPEKAKPYEIDVGDILFARTGATVGKSYLVKALNLPAVFASYLIRLRCSEEMLLPQFAAWYFRSREYWEQIAEGAEGTGQPNFNGTKLAGLNIPIPPLAEQRRIIAKLDVLTARLAGARVDLERVPILVRRTKQQALIGCFAEAGQSESDLGSLLLRIESGKNMRCEERPPRDGELGVVKVSAVTWGRFDSQESKTLPSDYIPPEKARIRAGDLLISRANTLELVGAVVLVDSEPRGLFLSDKILRLVVEDDAKNWVLWFLRSSFGRRQIEKLATGNQLSMRNISQDALRRIRLPFPSAEIRRKLIEKVESAFARVGRIEAESARARLLLDRLEAAILTKAFKGELVPQHPNDEPASVILERINDARSHQAQSQPKRGRKASVPKTPREKAVMTKSRQDEDVKNKPYLANIIRQAGGSSKVEHLFKEADLPVTDFYKQLAWEVDQGHIHDENNQILRVA